MSQEPGESLDRDERRYENLVERIDRLIMALEKITPGYKCKICGVVRPANWMVYEIEFNGEWIRPCCETCARQKESRGPYPQQ